MKHNKHILKLLIFILLLPVYIAAQDYIPFPDSNAVWKVYSVPYPPDEPWTAKHYDYIILGDTLINNLHYTQLYKIEYNLYCSDIADTFYIGAYRNDVPNKIVFFNQDNEEKILYNFSLGIGDTIPTSYFIETDGMEMIICDIDFIQLDDGAYRKQFTLQFPDPEPCHFKVVEGIGFLGGLLEPMSNFAHLINSSLLCYHENDSLLFIQNGWSICEVPEDTCILTIVENNNSQKNIIQIVPNPVISSSVIRFNNPKQIIDNYSLTLYNLVGENIITYPNINHGTLILNKHDFRAGIYTFVLRQENLIVQTGKIIIN